MEHYKELVVENQVENQGISLEELEEFCYPSISPSLDGIIPPASLMPLNNVDKTGHKRAVHSVEVADKKPEILSMGILSKEILSMGIGAFGRMIHGKKAGKQICPLCGFEGKTRNPYRRLQDHLGRTEAMINPSLAIFRSIKYLSITNWIN